MTHAHGGHNALQEKLELELPLRLGPSQCTCGPFRGVRLCADQSLGFGLLVASPDFNKGGHNELVPKTAMLPGK